MRISSVWCPKRTSRRYPPGNTDPHATRGTTSLPLLVALTYAVLMPFGARTAGSSCPSPSEAAGPLRSPTRCVQCHPSDKGAQGILENAICRTFCTYPLPNGRGMYKITSRGTTSSTSTNKGVSGLSTSSVALMCCGTRESWPTTTAPRVAGLQNPCRRRHRYRPQSPAPIHAGSWLSVPTHPTREAGPPGP